MSLPPKDFAKSENKLLLTSAKLVKLKFEAHQPFLAVVFFFRSRHFISRGKHLKNNGRRMAALPPAVSHFSIWGKDCFPTGGEGGGVVIITKLSRVVVACLMKMHLSKKSFHETGREGGGEMSFKLERKKFLVWFMLECVQQTSRYLSAIKNCSFHAKIFTHKHARRLGKLL